MLFSIRYCVATINWVQSINKLNNLKSGIGYGLRNKDHILQMQKYSQRRPFSYSHNTNIIRKFNKQCKPEYSESYRLGVELTNIRTLKTKKIVSDEPQGIHENISSLQMKTRLQRRKRLSPEEEEDRKKHGVW